MSSSITSPALFLKLDEFVSGKVADSSGNGKDGLIYGDPGLVPDEAYGSCLTFDGKDDFVKLPAMNIDFSNGITIEACVYFSSFKRWSRIIELGNGPNSNNIVLSNQDTTNNLMLSVYQGSASSALSAPGVLVTGKWLHIAATIDKNSNASLRIDGQVVASGHLQPPASINRQSNYVGKSNWSADELFQGRMANLQLYNRALSEDELLMDMRENLTAKSSFAVIYPLDFDLYDDDQQPALYIDNAVGHNLHIEISNTSRQAINFAAPSSATVGPTNYHFELRFRPNTLSQSSLGKLALLDGGWKMSQAQQSNGIVSLFFLSPSSRAIDPGKSLQLMLQQVSADGAGGSRGTRVVCNYRKANYSGEVTELTGTRLQHLSIVNASGQKNLPLHVGFLGANNILNNSNAENKMTLRMTNVLDEHPIYLNSATSSTPSKFILSFDCKAGEDWALGTPDEVRAIQLSGTGWNVVPRFQDQTIEWILTTSKTSLAPGEQLQLALSNIISSKPSGNTNLYLRYENIPGYADGQIVCLIEKGPIVYNEANVGIGTINPKAKLQVSNGAIMPAVGNTETTGIMFPKDPAGGSGDVAWVRYYPRQGEAMNLHLGIGNDADDNLVLTASGGIGLGTTSPSVGTKVTVSNPTNQLQLRREQTETTGGKILFLELYQNDVSTPAVPEVYPSIRFNHSNRFSKRIEARPNGIHFKDGDLQSDNYISMFAGEGRFSGNVFAGDGCFSGKVGAGTQTPSTNLSVTGSMNIGATTTAAGLVTKVFEGSIKLGQTLVFPLYTLGSRRCSHLEIVAMVQDTNSNSYKLYFKADYAWYRQWDHPPERFDLSFSYSKSLGQQNYTIDTIANGNDIQIKLSQTPMSADSVYLIVARYMMVSS